ncbi:MAG: SRPBCC domain-containing protein [Chlorobia bacterium]|nr:SRPBCC domain-containing protein [Fimbriimonadaceae bacterium]
MATRPKDTTKDETILAKTGKTREEWYAILDAFDRRAKGHKETANFLYEVHGVEFWYCQAITIEYERERGIREVGQRCDGKFAVSVTRTVAVPVQRAWDAWANADQVSTWFTTRANQDFREGGVYDNGDGDKGVYKRIVPPKRLVFTWENEEHCPGSQVIVEFLPKGEDKTSVVLTHERLPDKKGCEEMKEGWTWALTSLKSYLETGKAIGYEAWKASGAK